MPTTLRKLLVANRGEIAVRILRACRELGLPTVAVYSDADCHAPYVALADEAVGLGPAPAAESYLRSERVLAAARRVGADAIHPGYGFLSENPTFAKACAENGLAFVGPSADAISLLGDKVAARRLAEEAGVPVVPGYAGGDQSARRLRAEAGRVGFPLLVKATAGGGGRGMRLIPCAEGFAAGLEEARREAAAAFGDGRVFLERYLERPRHIEVQVFGDAHGSVVHLFERECSVQRRHQKIIEESPSPLRAPALHEQMADAALRLARAARYTNAGTVEFLLEERPDGDHRFYFLEVNTRLQVEHPVTELVTGIDLVKLQIRTAAGEPLPFAQSDVRAAGHAVEARICAEDPAAGFLPSVGRIEHWSPPAGPWVRVDSGVEQGSEVTADYDPMIAKLITWGQRRDEALARLEQALMSFHVLGVATNIGLLLDVVRHAAFRAGALSTGFLPDHFPAWRLPTVPPDVLLAVAAADQPGASGAPRSGDQRTGSDPWRSGGAWRNVRTAEQTAAAAGAATGKP